MTWIPRPLTRSWGTVAATEEDFERLYHTELPRIYNFFRYRVGDDALAEDLTAETFEKVWQHRSRYRRDLASFTTWLFTIARRVAIDHYRKRRAHLPLEHIAHLTADDSPEEHAQARADTAHLAALLAQLNERDREVIALKYGAGLSNREIASLTALSESNVGVILHRTIKALRSHWEANP